MLEQGWALFTFHSGRFTIQGQLKGQVEEGDKKYCRKPANILFCCGKRGYGHMYLAPHDLLSNCSLFQSTEW